MYLSDNPTIFPLAAVFFQKYPFSRRTILFPRKVSCRSIRPESIPEKLENSWVLGMIRSQMNTFSQERPSISTFIRSHILEMIQ